MSLSKPLDFGSKIWSALTGFTFTQAISLVTMCFSLVTFFSYFYKVDDIYRIIDFGPATNPLTAICLIMLSGSIFLTSMKLLTSIQKLFITLILVFTSVRLVDGVFGTQFHDGLTPFQQFIDYERLIGFSNAMGLNTAAMLFLAALSLLLLLLEKPFVALILLIVSAFFPSLSLIGYLSDFSILYNEMSITTAVLGVAPISGLIFFIRDKYLTEPKSQRSRRELIEWSQDFSVGDEIMDSQHKEFVSLLNKLNRLNKFSQKSQVNEVLLGMSLFAKKHLVYEEAMLHRIGYPDVESHSAVHQYFITKLDQLIEQACNHHDNLPEETIEFLSDWLMHHILDEDMKYRPFIKAYKDQSLLGKSKKK